MAPPARLQVPRPGTAVPYTVLLGWLLAQVARAADTTGRAYNLTWKSTNFKTILEWEPKPIDHVYTVQISTRLENWKSKCFFTTETECDLTDEVVKDVGQTYMARVLSYPARHGNTTGFPEEPPFRNSPEFTPILDTNLGQPTIQSFEQVGTKLNVTVQDARTLVRRNGTFLSLRAVFGKDLNYTLYYWRASSTGKISSTGAQLGWMCLNRVFFRLGRGILRSSRKLISRVTSDPTRKTATTNTNEFLIDVDKGENYCFSVQAVIPSRKRKQRSPESITECTSREKGRAREMFFIIGAVVVVALLIIVLSVTVYKCRKARAGPSAKESSPLNIA